MHFLYFIVNKQSRNSKEVFKKLALILPKYKINYEFLITENIEQLETLLSQLKNKLNPSDLFVVVGGDGSLNQFVSFYTRLSLENAIGYIPAGSGNDFARAHQIPFDTEEALLHLFSVEEKQELSVISSRQNEKQHLAVNSIGFGIDGLIGEIVEAKGKKERLGASSYLLGIFSAFRKQEKFTLKLTVDSGSYEFSQVQLAVLANNPSFAGGVYILPDANGKDDVLDIMIAENVSPTDLIAIVSRLLANQSHLSHPKIHSFRSKEVRIEINSNQYAQKDGEVFQEESYDYHFHTIKVPFWV